MPEATEPEDLDLVKRILSGSGLVTRLVQGVLGIASVIGLLQALWDAHPWRLGLSVAVVLLVIAWVLAGAYLRRRRPRSAFFAPEPRATSSYLRGLLPFERQDKLLGRDTDVQRLLAMVRSLEFRCGFVSGEAGAGKTSLLRAKMVPDLEKTGWCPIYVPRITADPVTAIRKAVLASLPTLPAPEEVTKATSPAELCRRAAVALPDCTFLLILDQFEEYFITQHSAKARRIFEDALRQIVQAAEKGTPIRILFVLRKEFVDDLLDFATWMPELQKNLWRQPVRNLLRDVAREVLRTVAQDEGLRFSDQLQDLVVDDLAVEGRVRPVEFQIVMTRLLDHGTFDVAAYRKAGGAQGIIARFIGEMIEPPEAAPTELQRRIAKFVLRLLCNENFVTRRPDGLTEAELLERVHTQIQSDEQMSASRAECGRALQLVLRRFAENFVVIQEDESRFNLAHDYLASPVRDATADVETVEERANRLLEQYVEQCRADRAVILPYRTLLTITRFASPERLTRAEAASLVRRSLWRFRAQVTAISMAVLAIVTLLLPFGTRFPIVEHRPSNNGWQITADGRLLIQLAGTQLSIIRLDDPKFSPHVFGVPVRAFTASPRGASLLAVGMDDILYLGEARNAFRPERLLDQLGWRSRNPIGDWGGFSRDGRWLFAVSSDGWIYSWPIGGRPRRLLHLSLEPAEEGAVASVPSQESEPRLNSGRGLRVGMTSDNRLLWAVDGARRLFLVRPGTPLGDTPPAPLIRLQQDISARTLVTTSPDSKWLAVVSAYGSGHAVAVHKLNADGPTLENPRHIVVDPDPPISSFFNDYSLVFSPDSKWLFGRTRRAELFAVRLDRATPAHVLRPARIRFTPQGVPIGAIRPGSDLVFAQDGRFAAGWAEDSRIHVWPLVEPPWAPTKPVYDGGYGLSDGFQTAHFCMHDAGVLVGGGDGTIHHVALEPPGAQARQIGLLTPGVLKFIAAADDRTVYMHNANIVAFAACGESPRTALESSSDIVAISEDGRGHLVVIGTRQLVRLDRWFYLWGLPVWRMPWPAIQR